jgi:V/A-type H+-transporting ATPase subunit E
LAQRLLAAQAVNITSNCIAAKSAIWGVYMTGIQKIIDHIEADAAAERAAISAEAEARCAELDQQYTQAGQAEYQRILSDSAKIAEQRLEYHNRIAVLEANKQVLTTKQELLRAAFERAAILLAELPDDLYVPLLARLASDAAQTGSEKLAFSARDASRIGEAVRDAANELLRLAGKSANLSISADSRMIRGGVIVTSGDIETNCSVDVLVSQLRNTLSGKVSEKLFG